MALPTQPLTREQITLFLSAPLITESWVSYRFRLADKRLPEALLIRDRRGRFRSETPRERWRRAHRARRIALHKDSDG